MILHVSVCTNRNDVFPKLVFGPISIYWGGGGACRGQDIRLTARMGGGQRGGTAQPTKLKNHRGGIIRYPAVSRGIIFQGVYHIRGSHEQDMNRAIK